MSILLYMILFVVFQPGVLLTLPAVGRSVFMSGKMSVQAVMVHALIFALVVHFFRRGGYFEGFATAASLTVVKATEAYAKELGAPKITLARLNTLDARVNKELTFLNARVKSLEKIQLQYAGKPVPVSAKATLDKGATELAQKKAEIALYKPIADMIAAKRTQLDEMAKKTIESASASLPPAIVSQLKQSASQLSASQIAALQKVVSPMVTASEAPSTILAAVKAIAPNISMPNISMPFMTDSISKMSTSMPMITGSIPTISQVSPSVLQALSAKYGFKI